VKEYQLRTDSGRAQSVDDSTVPVPYSEACESGVIGCCFLEPSLLDEVASKISLSDFYDLRHRNTLELMLSMRGEGLPVDLISINEEAKAGGGVAELGGLGYLSSHENNAPTTSQLPYFLSVVKRKAQRRELVQAARGILSDRRGDDEEVIGDHLSRLSDLLSTKGTGGEVRIKAAVRQAVEEVEAACASGGKCTGVSTGLPSLDSITGGLQPGDMFVLAARPSVGKTSLAMSIAENVGIDQSIPVGVASLEMTAVSLVKRMLSSRAQVDGWKLLGGRLTKGEIAPFTAAASQVAQSKIYINQQAHLSPAQLMAQARLWKLKYGIKLLIVDYLQLMRCKSDSRIHEVTLCSAAIKQIAKELNIPVLILSQLNRMVEQQDRQPRLSDLRDSGSIEQDADVVGLMHVTDSVDKNLTRLTIAKHRNGPTGYCDLEFIKEQTKFKECLPR